MKSMTTNVGKFAAILAAAGLVLGTFVLPARAATVAELQAMIAELTAQIAALSGSTTSSAAVTFTTDLTIGSTGADVTALQNWLISKGHTIAAGATGYFGEQTRAALAAYQAANGITPASGYFGPITRAKVNASGSTTTGGTTTGGTTTTGGSVVLAGGEGQIKSIDALGDIESEIDENDTEQVLGAEIEAEDSDISIQRVDVEISTEDATGGQSKHLDDYITEVGLVFNGKTIATMDVDEADEDDDVYTFRFTGLNAVIEEDETAELYVTATAVGNIDSEDDLALDVSIPEDGIRAVDAAGISETYVDENEADDLMESFSIATPTAGELDLNESDENPDSMTVQIDEENDTTGVAVLEFELEADNQDITIDSIPVSLSSTASTSNVVKKVTLKDGSKTLKTKTVSGTAKYNVVEFDNLDLTVEDGDSVTLSVYVDLNDEDASTFPAGTTLVASTTKDLSGWDVEDEEGDSVDVGSGPVVGGTMTFEVSGIAVSGFSSTVTTDKTEADDSTTAYGTYTMTFDVAAFEETQYIKLGSATRGTTGTSGTSTGANYTIESLHANDNGEATTSGSITSAVLERVSGGTISGDFIKINAGQTAKLRLEVVYDPAFAAAFRAQLYSVNFADSASVSFNEKEAVTPAEDFETTSKSITN